MPPGDFVEVFILQGLRGATFVSIVDTGLTGAYLVKKCAVSRNGIDSIGLAKWKVCICGSADSKEVAIGDEVTK